jgi:hypothetical protein
VRYINTASFVIMFRLLVSKRVFYYQPRDLSIPPQSWSRGRDRRQRPRHRALPKLPSLLLRHGGCQLSVLEARSRRCPENLLGRVPRLIKGCPACGCIQRSAKENERGPPSRSEKIARQNPRRLRDVRGLSWSELAAEAKITRSQLNRLEKGAYIAGFDTVSKLATP